MADAKPATNANTAASSVGGGAAATGGENVPATAGEHDWLEDVEKESNLEWVREQNKATLSRLGDPQSSPLYDRVLRILNSKDKIAYVHRRDNWFYNFWQDKQNVQGIWRRTTLESFQTAEPEWQIMLDLDKLSKEEGTTWVWKGSTWFFDDVGIEQDICLIKLSRGGADATVLREYDVRNCKFFEPGPDVFSLPESKQNASYKTRDILLVGTNVGPDAMTASGYPRQVREWKRGTKLEDAPIIFEGKKDDVLAYGYVHKTQRHTYEWQERAITFWKSQRWVREGIDEATAGPLVKLDVPEDSKTSCIGSSLLVELRSAWDVGGKSYEMGSLISFDFQQYLKNDYSSAQVLFAPDKDGRAALSTHTNTLNYLILKVLDNVCTKLVVYKREPAGHVSSWKLVEVKFDTGDSSSSVSVDAQISIWGEDEDTNDMVWMTTSGFLEPTTLLRAEVGDTVIKGTKMKSLPAVYDAAGLEVSQSQAISKDGTAIPYFMVSRKDLEHNSKQPTLLYGYGGFEIPMLPFYASKFGAGWLERGGIFVLANIRGGGEFGPKWHQAALKEKRHKAYEDFEAVASHLIAEKICCRETLGCMGGSNGGLLTGNMLVRSPDKFGAIVCQMVFDYVHRAGASWVAEYGDPDKPEEWDFVKTISPYHNVADNSQGNHPYPDILFTTSTRDDRVHPGHARKMVKRLQENGHDSTTYYYENIEGGHGGAANNKQRAFMSTLGYEFLWNRLSAASSK